MKYIFTLPQTGLLILLVLFGIQAHSQIIERDYGTDCEDDPQAFVANCSGNCSGFSWSITGDYSPLIALNTQSIGGFSWTSPGSYFVSVSFTQDGVLVNDSYPVTINGTSVPEVTISVSPSGSIVYGTPVTFAIASSSGGGLTPTYQWRLNDEPQDGATGTQYQRSDFQDGDEISVTMTSNAVCSSPSSDNSNVLAVSVSYLLSSPIVQNATTEYNSGVTLSANGAGTGEIYRWYTAPTGGSFFEGPAYETPPLTTQTTYYVAKRNSAGDESPRALQTVTITTDAPDMPSMSLNSCGPKVLTRGTPPDGVTWYWVGTNENGISSDSNPTYIVNNANNETYYLRAMVDNTWGPAVGITVTTDPVDLVLTKYDAAEVQATNSITLAPGFTVPAGKSFTANIGISSECNDVYNWSEQITYNETGDINSRSKTYVDGFGEALQSQSIDYENKTVWVSQPVYDFQNQPSITTLPAPLRERDFIYKKNFVTSSVTNQAYAPSDFDNPDGTLSGKVVSPNPVGTAPGTLGWYYSSENNLESRTPVTNFPYSRSYTPPGPDPVETISAGPGDNYKMGSGHEVRTEKKIFVKSELDNYFDLRHYFVATSLPVSQDGVSVVSLDGATDAGVVHVGDVSHTLVTQNNENYIEVQSNESQGNPGVQPLSNSINVTSGEIYVFRVKGYRNASGLVALRIKNASNNEDIVWPGAALPGDAVNEDWIENTFVVPDGCTSINLSVLWSAHVASGDSFYINELSLTRVTNLESMPYGYKIISRDPDGKKAVIFSDADGRVLASAVITSESGTNPTMYTYDHWNYTYYNESGQVVASVAPNGVTGGTTLPNFVTYTKYDHLGRIIETSLPDEGMSQFVYNLDGQIRFSQSEVQRNYLDPDTQAPTPKFSYTNYDYLGRLIESGEYTSTGTTPFKFEPHTMPPSGSSSVLNITENKGFTGVTRGEDFDATNADPRYTDFNYIQYDVKASDFTGGPSEQSNLFGQVSKTQNEISKTWYSYDEFGQLTWTKQHINGLGDKIIDYRYDYFGNVTQVAYQKGTTVVNEPTEEYYHHYVYDINQRLSEVHTSRNGVDKTLQAKYVYYLHGPLKRVELADNLQGIDYVYNIDGSLKMINHADPNLDPGQDGLAGDNSNFMADIFGETLDYNTNDYTGAAYNDGTLTLNTHPDQFGGGVKAIRWHSPTDMHVPRAYAFTYDNLNQMQNADFGNVTGSTGTYGFSVNGSQAYKESVGSYDNNGNIKSLARKGKTGNTLADYDYEYIDLTNKLETITHENNPFLSYEYNAIGQMTKQTEGAKSMEVSYNAYGLIREVKKFEGVNVVQRVTYEYDDRGDRIKKTVLDATNVESHLTYYVSDASGNTIATYEKIGADGAVTLADLPIYGVGRIAMYKPQLHTTLYEVSDHLGNVRGVIGNPETLIYTATLEDNNQPVITNPRVQEIAYFKNLWDVAEDDHPFANHTVTSEHVPNPTYSAYLHWIDGQLGNDPETKSVGPAIGLKVEPGDVIDMEAYAKYEKKIGNYSRPGIGAAMATILGNSFVGTAAGIDMIANATQVFQNGLTPLLGTAVGNGNDENTLPHAYLYYALYDRNFTFITGGWSRVSSNGGFDPGNEAFSVHEKLTIPTVTITQPGYIYVFVANESEELKVWFDDIQVAHQRSTIVAGADYYPFGLVMADREITREDYRYGYQGQFSDEDYETGWNAFELRMYDARIARWTTIDPYGEFFSPYMAMANTPQKSTDPDGGCSDCDILRAMGQPVLEHLDIVAAPIAILQDGSSSWFAASKGLLIEPEMEPSFEYKSLNHDYTLKRPETPLYTFDVEPPPMPPVKIDPMGGIMGDAIRSGREPIGRIITNIMTTAVGPEVIGGKLLGAAAGVWIKTSKGIRYTKSSLKYGRKIHKAYKAALHNPALKRFKEFTGIKGIRPDFVDFNTRTIYELKPNNPRSIHRGYQQLKKYKKMFEKRYGGKWNTVLDTY